jgi:hypothetical protein
MNYRPVWNPRGSHRAVFILVFKDLKGFGLKILSMEDSRNAGSVAKISDFSRKLDNKDVIVQEGYDPAVVNTLAAGLISHKITSMLSNLLLKSKS